MNDEIRQLIAEVRSLRDRVAQLEAANLSLSAADMLAAIKTVDGTGSGLDADTVDGVQASAIGQLGVAATWTQSQLFQSGLAVGVSGATLARPAQGIIRQKLESVTVANDGTLTISSDAAARGVFVIYNATDGAVAMCVASGSAGVTLIHNGGSLFSATAGNANTVNAYTSGNDIIIQNKRGGNRSIQVWLVL